MPGSGKYPSAGMSGDVDIFTSYLREWKKDWLLVERRGDQYAHLRFTGLFQDKGVVWDCQFSTLVEARARRNFIDYRFAWGTRCTLSGWLVGSASSIRQQSRK